TDLIERMRLERPHAIKALHDVLRRSVAAFWAGASIVGVYLSRVAARRRGEVGTRACMRRIHLLPRCRIPSRGNGSFHHTQTERRSRYCTVLVRVRAAVSRPTWPPVLALRRVRPAAPR